MERSSPPTISPARGWLLIVIGSLLSVAMALLTVFFGWTIASKESGPVTHWTGSHEMTRHVFELFVTIFVFGLVAVIAGVFQLRRGRVNQLAVVIMLILLGMIFVTGYRIIILPH